jgi:hypothetical protein
MNAPDENNTSYSVSSYSVCSVAETAVRNRPNDFSRRDSPDRDRFGHLYYPRDARGRFRWAKRGQQQSRHKECHLPHFIHHLIADITWVRRRCSKGVPPDGGALLDSSTSVAASVPLRQGRRNGVLSGKSTDRTRRLNVEQALAPEAWSMPRCRDSRRGGTSGKCQKNCEPDGPADKVGSVSADVVARFGIWALAALANAIESKPARHGTAIDESGIERVRDK